MNIRCWKWTIWDKGRRVERGKLRGRVKSSKGKFAVKLKYVMELRRGPAAHRSDGIPAAFSEQNRK